MNLSAWSIRTPVPSILLFTLLTIIGLYSFKQMGIQHFPDIEFPMITVTASLEGSAPSQLETDVARKLEDHIATIDSIRHIHTTITDGRVMISIEFELEKNGEEALNQIRNAIDLARPELPAQMQPPTISKVSTSGAPFATYYVHSDGMSEEALSWFVDDVVDKSIRSAPGVGAVHRIGGVDREIIIALNTTKMSGLGISVSTVASQFSAMRKNFSAGDGRILGQKQAIRTLASATSLSDLKKLSIPLGDGRQIKLSSIATIKDTHAERSSIALLNKKKVVAFQITRSKGASEISVSEAVDQQIAELRNHYSEVEFRKAYDTITPVRENYSGSMNMLYEGAFLAIIVVFWFLKDWRATLVSATALPLSIIPTFAAMYFLDFSLNQLTLLSLALVIGILVDDAIVEVENIMRHLNMGKSAKLAATEASDEIGLAVIATTFTLVAVFLPTAFMSGVTGKFFKQFGLTASIAILFSLLVARLLTPMMAAYILKPFSHQEKDGWLMQHYLRLARWCQKNRRITLCAAIIFFVASVMLIPLLPTGFVPPADTSQTQVTIELPPGSHLAHTHQVAQQAIKSLERVKDVKHIFATVGAGSGGGSGPGQSTSTAETRKATLVLTLTPRNERERHQNEIEKDIRHALTSLTGTRVTVGDSSSGKNLQITLTGDNTDALYTSTRAVERDLRTIQGIGSISSGTSLQRPEIHITPNYDRAAELGITSQQMANLLRMASYGDYSQHLAKLNLPQRQIPIRIRMDQDLREDIEAIRQLRIPLNQGMTTLGNIAQVQINSDVSRIDRRDRSRQTTISVSLGGRSMGEVMHEVAQLPSLNKLPAGVHQVESGEAEQMTQLFESFGTAILIGIICIYVVLVLLFHDFLQPITILAAIPLSAGGALIALLITHNSLSLPSVIGVIMLMGVVTKNSILLVEYASIARHRHGMDRYHALMDACHKRARPIVMTTIAMGFGMLPTALGIGTDSSFRGPMAIVVIGGLITSTFLSLLVIPVVFTYIDDLLQLIKRQIKTGVSEAANPKPGELTKPN
ncbi:efflux RND transporter permease subunit [bacterium AH-315-K03]|nr:efflux RND transporter permease subunit [bacterium AH-315-K03]